MPNGTITSTENTFGTVNGALSGTVAGTLTGSVGVPGPIGPAGPGSTWGGIAGTLSAQTDLWTELGTKYLASNPAGYQTAGQVSTALAPYITSATASASFYPLSGNPSAFLQAAALTPYLLSATASTTYQTLAGMSSYLTTSAAAAGYYPLSGNPSGFLTSASLSGYATETFVTSQGYITSSALTPYLTTASAALNYAPIAAGQPASGTVGQVLTKNSGTNYDSSWQTLIPGDRYLTTSTTSNTVSNGNKTFTIGTGLSYTPTQSITISYDASNHMHGEVLTYNSGTGVLTVDINHHTGSGTYAVWVVNVGGVVPATSVTWGSITGTLGDQTDLANALNDKLELSGGVLDANATIQSSTATEVSVFSGSGFNVELTANPSENSVLGYGGLQVQNFAGTMAVTPSGLTFPNASTQTVAYPGSTGFLLKADNLAGLANTATAQTNLGLGTMATATAADYSTTTAANLLYYPLSGNPSSFLVAADITGKANLASPALTGNVTITTNSTSPALVITQDGTGDIVQFKDVTSDTTYALIDANGKVSTIPSTTANAGFNVPHATAAPTTPVNGDIWSTTAGLFARINAGTRQFATLSDGQSFSGNNTFTGPTLVFGNTTAASTIGIGTGATISGSTRVISIGTASAAGSTNNINIGGGSGTTNVTLGGSIALSGPVTSAVNNITLGTGTAASVYAFGTGATVSGLTKTVSIGTNGAAGSTTNIAIGSTTGTSTTTLQGITNGVTQTAGDSSLKLATTAFVTTADNLKANLASPALTGTPTAPTATLGTNTTQIATTAFVLANAGSTSFATASQALALTSNTVSISPLTLQRVIMHPSFRRITSMAGNSVSTTSGTGSSNYVSSNWIENIGPSSGATGSAMVTPANVAGVDSIGRLSEANIDFSKRIILCGKFSQAAASGYLGDANNYWMFSLGKASAYYGNFTGRAIGIRKFGSTANFFLVVHDGTTLTAVDSGVGNNSYSATTDFTIVSDGAGNVTLFIDDNQVATTSAGPTGTATNGSRIYAEVNQVGTFGARIAAHTGNIGIYIAP